MNGSNFIVTGASSVIAINLALRPLAAYSRKHQRCVDFTYIHADYFIMCDRNLESVHCRRLTPPKQVMGGEFRASYLFVKGLVLKGIYGREIFETWYKMSSLIQAGLDLKPMITHHFPIDDFQQGFDIMGSGQSGKVILDWSK